MHALRVSGEQQVCWGKGGKCARDKVCVGALRVLSRTQGDRCRRCRRRRHHAHAETVKTEIRLQRNKTCNNIILLIILYYLFKGQNAVNRLC